MLRAGGRHRSRQSFRRWLAAGAAVVNRVAEGEVVSTLLTSEELQIEEVPVLRAALGVCLTGNADFADCVIGTIHAGCATSLTFDKKAARLAHPWPAGMTRGRPAAGAYAAPSAVDARLRSPLPGSDELREAIAFEAQAGVVVVCRRAYFRSEQTPAGDAVAGLADFGLLGAQSRQTIVPISRQLPDALLVAGDVPFVRAFTVGLHRFRKVAIDAHTDAVGGLVGEFDPVSAGAAGILAESDMALGIRAAVDGRGVGGYRRCGGCEDKPDHDGGTGSGEAPGKRRKKVGVRGCRHGVVLILLILRSPY